MIKYHIDIEIQDVVILINNIDEKIETKIQAT